MSPLNEDRGAAAVEFALVLPLLLVLVFAIVDFGRAFFIKETLNHAAREGARALALGQTAAVARGRAQTAARDVSPTSVSVQFTQLGAALPATATCTGADEVSATVTLPFAPITPLP